MSAKAPANIVALNNPDTEDCVSPVLGSLVAFRFTGFATSEVIAEADVEALVLALVETLMLADND
ncbi:hypothetical protein [Streptococcus suis]|uniref:hypothetical protein n=1 Tax=Streptococcus suis TaxID=1307 RepID=UPI0038B7757B